MQLALNANLAKARWLAPKFSKLNQHPAPQALRSLCERPGQSRDSPLHAQLLKMLSDLAEAKEDELWNAALPDGPPRSIASFFCGLKALAEARFGAVDDECHRLLRGAYQRMFSLLEDRAPANCKPVEIANSFNGLKAALAHEVFAAWELTPAFSRLIALVKDRQFAGANAQHIANSFNGLKAALEHRVFPADDPNLKPAFSRLIALVKDRQFAGANAQAIANTFNGLKAALDHGVFPADDPNLKPAFSRLIALMKDRQFAGATAQVIANSFNGLKAALDHGVFPGDDPNLKPAFSRLIALINQGTLAGAKPQEIANTFNGLKATLDHGVFPADDPNLKPAFSRLIALIHRGKLADAKPQEIANTFNGLKSALEHGVFTASDLKLAFSRLIALVRDRQFDRAEPQHIANIFNGLKTALDHKVFPLDDSDARGVAALLFRLGMQGGMAEACAVQMRSFLRATAWLTRKQVLPMDLMREQAQAQAQNPSTAAITPTARVNTLALLQHFMGTEFLGLDAHWPAMQGLLLAASAAPMTEDQGAVFLSAGVGLYRRLRLLRSPGPGVDVERVSGQRQQLVESVLAGARQMPWAQGFQGAAHALTLRSACLQLHMLQDLLMRSKGRGTNKTFHTQALELLSAHAIPRLEHAVRQRQQPGDFDATNLEVVLIGKYLSPARALTPPVLPGNAPDLAATVRTVWNKLEHAPRPMAQPGAPWAMKAPLVDAHGRVLRDAAGRPRFHYRDASIYAELFPGLAAPIEVHLGPHDHPENLPAFIRHDKRWYRTDLFRGGANKPTEDRPPRLWAVPVEAARFMARKWLTSKESRCYAQRAFLPEAPDVAPTRAAPTAALKGRFQVQVVPDDAKSAPAFAPGSCYTRLRVRDGCGFIRQSLVSQMAGSAVLKDTPPHDAPRPADKGLPPEALQYYPAKGEALGEVVAEFLSLARKALGNKPLSDPEAVTDPKALAAGLMPGNSVAACLATAVPAAGDKLVLPDTPAWQALAQSGLIVGRDPYDTRNLLVLEPGDIEFTPGLESMKALQYSLSGYGREAGEGGELEPDSRFYKGLLVVVPDADWPSGSDAGIMVSSKDLKLCERFDSLQAKQDMQAMKHTPGGQVGQVGQMLDLRGCLVIKEQRSNPVAVPPAMQARLAGDYDGDLLKMISREGLSAFSAVVQAGNKKASGLGNPKYPKSFTPDADTEAQAASDVEKLMQLQKPNVPVAAGVAKRFQALPKERKQALIDAMAPDHVLEDLLQPTGAASGAWRGVAGLPEPEHEASGTHDERAQAEQARRRRRLVKREIEVLYKASTDEEKTQSPYNVVRERLRQYEREMGPDRPPYGKGLGRRLEKVAAKGADVAKAPAGGAQPPEVGQADKETLRALLQRELDATPYFAGLPNAIMAATLGWFLDSEPGEVVAQQVQVQAARPQPRPQTQPRVPDTPPAQAMLKVRDLLGVINHVPVELLIDALGATESGRRLRDVDTRDLPPRKRHKREMDRHEATVPPRPSRPPGDPG